MLQFLQPLVDLEHHQVRQAYKQELHIVEEMVVEQVEYVMKITDDEWDEDDDDEQVGTLEMVEIEELGAIVHDIQV